MIPHFSEPYWSNRMHADFHSEVTEPLPEELVWFAERFGVWSSSDSERDPGIVPLAPAVPHVYAPDNYEPNYPYPLVVWLTDPGHDEQELMDLVPRVSTQNYLATAVRGCSAADGLAAGLGNAHNVPTDELADRLHEHVCRVRSVYHVHSERIYVAGCDQAASLALELLLSRPEWFAGILGFGCVDLSQHQSLSRYHELRGKRVFIGADLRTPRKSLAVFVRTSRLLYTAGLNVSARLYEADQAVTSEMLADVNHWLMEGIYEANLV